MSLRIRLHDGVPFESSELRLRDKVKQSLTLRPHHSFPSQRQPRRHRLLDLPTEIRLQIYEAVFPPASVVLQSGDNPAMIAVLQSYPVLISRGSRDVQLFRTCRSCHQEASPIFYRSLKLLVYQHLHLLRLNFLLHIGAVNASFIRSAIITPIGLPGEHQRFLECLGPKHGGLVGLQHLTLEIWDPDHISAFVSTCKELIRRHQTLKIVFGRGINMDAELQAEDIPAKLRLALAGQEAGHREHIIDSASSYVPSDYSPRDFSTWNPASSIGSGKSEDRGRIDVKSRVRALRPIVNFSLPEPTLTIWSRYKLRREEKDKEKE